MENYVTVSEYAKLCNKDCGNIRRMLLSGRLQGEKIGNQWVIKKDMPYPADKRVISGKYRNHRKKNHYNPDKILVETLSELTEQLKSLYGEILSEIVLYGSYARGTQTSESDVDIAVLLNGTPSIAITDELVKCVSSLELKCDRVLSVVDIECKKFEQWCNDLPFYKNIKKEGIVLWKKAM